MRSIILSSFLISAAALQVNAQTFWTETFTNGCTAGCLASSYVGANGAWTETNTGTNGADPNMWYVSCAENGQAAGQCGAGCGNDASLHIGSNATVLGDNGASYLAGGLGFWFPQTDKRIESPTINCTGQTGITLAFNYIEFGQGTIDDATLWYFDGATWSMLINLAKTSCGTGAGCSPTACTGSQQGLWTAFSTTLPASANNNPNVKIGFRWVNNDDNVGTDPSIAVDDITLSVVATSGPTASFTASNQSLCTNDCISFTNTSTGGPFTSVSWTFNGGTPSTSNANNPTNICYSTPGVYDVTLTVTDANGTDTDTQVGFIVVNNCAGAPVASFTASQTNLCVNDCISFTNTSTGGPFTFTGWSFPGGTPSTSTAANPTNICYSTPGTYAVTLAVQDANGQDTTTINGYITVTSCSTPPTANFSTPSTTICAGDCIAFTDLSTGGATSWSWSFPGASTASSTAQNPSNICYPTAGTYTVSLTATNASGSDTHTMNLTVTTCTTPVASFTTPLTTLCTGNCITFTNTSVGATSYNWSFPGGIPASSTSANPGTVCFPIAGSYTITLIIGGAGGGDTATLNLTVNQAPWVVASADQTITMGDSTVIGAVGQDTIGLYVWTPSGSMNPSTGVGDTVTVGPVVTTCYIVSYDNGVSTCLGYDTVCIDVIPIELIGVPNAFSPNGDGINDFLLVYGSEIRSIHMRIYNRYGQLVYDNTETTLGWDGNFKGKPEDPGVFTWFVEYIFNSGKAGIIKGNTTLIR